MDSTPHTNALQRPCQQSYLDTAAESTADTKPTKTTFSDLPAELREMIWKYALPDSRVFNVLINTSACLKMDLVERGSLRIPIAHVCFESRQVVLKAGYILAFGDKYEPDDPGVFFRPGKDTINRKLGDRKEDFWGPSRYPSYGFLC
ncbi:uncharacterized protein GGS22DRAFT_16707 [Annulohypoxylon maeteangense]|uniref:uncharacterized protein n=1 Tax=Annulohypoxylon maeteangense TaxID=1927788 RepID=UPI002008E2EC|nr:uncharacterized protein GGS22DRAFT_16707 [Annulohypoxylon maeteangense]KAI0890666.1 hypothetical protein GGS22DRAFT_16707 [Annulohypoxylon maeteangense]